MDHVHVRDNRELHRFELPVDGQVVFAEYRRQPGRLVITYVEAPPSLRGAGHAGRLMQGVLEEARTEQVKVLPLCGYARAWMQRRPEYRDLTV
jgi:predicted GNAT family acetyltransferase